MNRIIFIALVVVSGACQNHTSNTMRSAYCELSELEVIKSDSICWNTAGVTDAFIPSSERANTDTLKEIVFLQEQLDRLGESGGGRLIVPQGNYEIYETVKIPSDVSVVGISRDSSVFEIKMKEVFEKSKHHMPPQGNSAAFLFDQVNNASLENLTIIYKAVDFEPFDFDEYDHEWVRGVFHGHDPRTDSLFVTSVWIERSENCKISHCNILQAGNDPIRIRLSEHITCSHNLVDRAYNKGGRGAGYYNLIHSHHCLLYNETVGRLRHLSIHKSSSYNVLYGCDLETDVNFHNGDRGHNLIENNEIRIPEWHSWRPFGTGSPSQHEAPGPYNILFRNQTDFKNRGPVMDPEVLYIFTDRFPSKDHGEEKYNETTYAAEFPNGIFDERRMQN